jgi:ribosomal protein S18 acetylase RimI-like enzyme
MPFELIAATPADWPWLENLRRAAYRDLFDATWGGWDEARHARHFAQCIEQGHIRIIELNGDRVGMVQVFDLPDAFEVGEIQVQPKHQGLGIGTRVLEDIIALAHADRKAVRLSVALKNERALRLYERLGFRRAGQSDTHNLLEIEPRAV